MPSPINTQGDGSPRNFAFGAATPPSFNVSAAIQSIDRTDITPLSAPDQPAIDLTDGFTGADQWAVRDQHHRGTCVAFAVVAAEELVAARRRPQDGFNDFSEEYLYRTMRNVSLGQLSFDTSTIDPQSFESQGATFLEQAEMALIADGLCRDDLLPYETSSDLPVGHVVPVVPNAAIQDAAERTYDQTTFTHNIVSSDSAELTGLDRKWLVDIEPARPSKIVFDRLTEGLPVVAAFAMLQASGAGAWTDYPAREYGRVSYVGDSVALGLTAAGGHAVCIFGFIPDPDEATGGNFVFRNSRGTQLFGRRPGTRPNPPRAPWPGYGTISATDVDRYMWEYLHRTDPRDAIPIA